MADKIKVSISTKNSRDLIKHYNKIEKDGQVVDWKKAFEEIEALEAKGKHQEIQAIAEKKR
jgi:hypothetical protein